MSADPFKLAFALVVATVSWLVLSRVHGRPDEVQRLDRLTWIVFTGRVVLTLVVYLAAPALVQHSDAIAFYLPETESLLAGGLPYRDFVTNYGPLFHGMLAPAVALWHSPGAIVLVMLMAEAGLLVVYRRFGARSGHDLRFARGAWLMVSSPMMVYWVGVVGYNGVLIALFSMLGLVMACSARPFASGLVGSLGWLACKALGVLSWPTIVLARNEGVSRRVAAFAVVGLALGVALFAGFDVLMPLRREHDSWTSGNVWFLASVALPSLFKAPVVSYLAAASFAGAWVLITWRWLKHRHPGTDFDTAVAHLTFVMTAFMLLSHKSPVMYTPMLAPFAIHTVLADGSRLRTLLPVLILGALATMRLESVWLGDMITSRHLTSTNVGLIALAMETLKMGAFVALAMRAWQAVAGDQESF